MKNRLWGIGRFCSVWQARFGMCIKKGGVSASTFGLCGFPKIKESCYYDGSGHFRPATKEDKVGFLCSIQSLAALSYAFFNLRITR